MRVADAQQIVDRSAYFARLAFLAAWQTLIGDIGLPREIR